MIATELRCPAFGREADHTSCVQSYRCACVMRGLGKRGEQSDLSRKEFYEGNGDGMRLAHWKVMRHPAAEYSIKFS